MPGPSATLTELQALYGEKYRWLLLLAVMVGTMAAIMSSTIINVAVPDMSRHFGLGQERAQWVASGFMIAMTVSMLTTPWLLARYGYRRTYAGTMLVLLAGNLVGALAHQRPFLLGEPAHLAEDIHHRRTAPDVGDAPGFQRGLIFHRCQAFQRGLFNFVQFIQHNLLLTRSCR